MGTTLVEEEEEEAPVLIIRGFQGSDQKTKTTLYWKSRSKKNLKFFFDTSKKNIMTVGRGAESVNLPNAKIFTSKPSKVFCKFVKCTEISFPWHFVPLVHSPRDEFCGIGVANPKIRKSFKLRKDQSKLKIFRVFPYSSLLLPPPTHKKVRWGDGCGRPPPKLGGSKNTN